MANYQSERLKEVSFLGKSLKAVGLLNLLRLHPEQVRDSERIYIKLADFPSKLR
jgi:hypothetical protein